MLPQLRGDDALSLKGALSLGGALGPGDARLALEARHKVRLQFFDDAEYDALFAREAELDRYTLARLEIERNTQLSPEQRAQALQAADDELSAERRAERSAATEHMAAAAQTAAFNATNADERTRYAARAAGARVRVVRRARPAVVVLAG